MVFRLRSASNAQQAAFDQAPGETKQASTGRAVGMADQGTAEIACVDDRTKINSAIR